MAKLPIFVGIFFFFSVLMIRFASKPDIALESDFSLWNYHCMTQRKQCHCCQCFFRLETELENCLTYLASLWMSPQTASVGKSWRRMGDDVRGICFLYHLHLIINIVVIKYGSSYFGRLWNQNAMPLEARGVITRYWMKTIRQCGDLMKISVQTAAFFLMLQTVVSTRLPRRPCSNTWESVILT